MSFKITLLNQTDSQFIYVNNQITVPASGQVDVQSGLIPFLATDAPFINDILSVPPNIIVSDGVAQYSGPAAQNFVNMWLQNGVPQLSNDPVSFCLAGFGFSANADAMLSSSIETSLVLLKNPSNSGVNARAMFFFASPESANGIVTVRAYTNPTVTANGNPLTPSNNLVSNTSPSSAMNLYLGPTTSSNGIKRISIVSVGNSNTAMLNFSQTVILTPGNTLLITASVTNLGLLSSALTHFYMQWVEV